ncbi:hypothetical protein AMQ28_13225 [Acinetobacter sp. TTH0-4]|uniref:phage antirepressor N-terminal domain-containing protein n=1 Tax=Acinetobacter sp. TTH0-4 TaxID=1646498 RepID=UPI0006BC80C4|nr:phage antirepressor N-terminal domain-containing protein [Acinetobacter sp. TTH0-4]ALD03213.1 hypothetical protein AMQ28_13225 [Acinetobacter sp. TTH0-4]
MTSLTQIAVPFHNAELYIVEYEGQPYTPMKPIVDGIGLDWASQFVKLKQRFSSTIVEITIVANDGKERLMTCLPVKKLFGWLMTISPNKVKPELRDTVIKYQEECDDVLWDYWTKGKAVNPRPKTHKSERTPLHDAHAMLVAKTKHLSSSDAWKIINQRFGTEHIEDIPYDAIPVAVEYVHHLIALYSNADKQGGLFDQDTYELVRELTEAILTQNGMMQDVWKALMLIDQKDMLYYSSYITRSNTLARKVGIEFDFRTKQGLPLVDGYCKTINFSSGHRLGVNPKWFDAPAW